MHDALSEQVLHYSGVEDFSIRGQDEKGGGRCFGAEDCLFDTLIDQV
jgi:hypothetical protein